MTVGTMAEGATSAHALPPARGARIVEMRRRNDRREVPGGRDGREGRRWETWESTSNGHASGHSSRSACDRRMSNSLFERLR